MDILQLRYFRTVARTEHITKAAEELRIAQPSLSMMISRLESELGVALFDRQGRNIKLNEYGKVFLRNVEQSMFFLEQGKHEVKQMAGLEEGSISLVTSTVQPFKDLLKSFLAKYPKVNLRINQHQMVESRIRYLEQGEADFYLASPPIEKPGVQSVSLWTDELMLAVPSSHRLAARKSIPLKEAQHEPFIGLKPNNSARKSQEGFCLQAGFQPRFVCEVDEPAAILLLVGTGLGVAIVPGPTGGQDPSVTYLRIKEPECHRTIQLAWLESRFLSKAAISFREHAIHFHQTTNTSMGW